VANHADTNKPVVSQSNQIDQSEKWQRVKNGAMGARFTQYLSFILSDVRRLLL